ncbi:FG-GAP repeat domain-containing protein [Gemmatimonas sp.]|uniref:FG-GAP repeat domain-containing protein n=1 Tax=Gemmatimonas sp. TaxID=1962908 RepID=UPI00398305CF
MPKLLAAACALAAIGFAFPRVASPRFETHVVARDLTGGYQVLASDLNRDGRPDLVVVSDLPEIVWFENPSWKRHVLARGLVDVVNVAAADADGDGVPEIAIASGFSTTPGESAGIVTLLTHGADVTGPWTAREIDRTPSAHRLRWFVDGDGARWLMNAPLAAASSGPPMYAGATPIYAYRAPAFRRDSLPSAESGVVHALEPMHAPFCEACLVAAGFAGLHRYERVRNAWRQSALAPGDAAPVPNGGSSEAATGRLPGGRAFLASIEPWHGRQVVVYTPARGGAWTRQVIDTALVDGHTLVAADFDGDGVDELVAGQRGGTRSVWIYTTSSDGMRWTRTVLDDGGMGAAGCATADLDGDGRTDVACVSTATATLKWYRNVAPARTR